jgi:hypothetical protein
MGENIKVVVERLGHADTRITKTHMVTYIQICKKTPKSDLNRRFAVSQNKRVLIYHFLKEPLSLKGYVW